MLRGTSDCTFQDCPLSAKLRIRSWFIILRCAPPTVFRLTASGIECREVLMPSDLVRFLHAGDFHLERPLRGLPEVPDELRERLVDASRLAAQRVFETAILEEVDFVVLSGDIMDPRATDPRGMAFLLEQFDLLRDQGIAVYWAGGDCDRPERWPEAVGLPANVHVFSSDRVEEIAHVRDKRPVAALLGTSQRDFRSTEFRGELSSPLAIAVVHGNVDPTALEHAHVDYWALGGRHERQALSLSTSTAQYPGCPQGGSPAESGTHGCLVVRGGDGGRPQVQFVATDVVRWHTVRVSAGDLTTRDELQSLLMERIRGLAAESADQPLLVTCLVEASGRLGSRLRQDGLGDEILAWLRKHLLKATPPAWVVALESPFNSEVPNDWRDEDTILGDYLRAVEQTRGDRRQGLDLSMFLPSSQPSRDLESLLLVSSDEVREHILQQAVEMGADLLRGENV
jgi:exonuclease SbcD